MARIIPLPRPMPAAASTSVQEDEAMLYGDRDLLIAGVLFWLASAARVIAAFVHREVFGVESSLAFLCILFLPWLFWRSRSARTSGSETTGGWAPGDEPRMGIVVPFVRVDQPAVATTAEALLPNRPRDPQSKR